MKCFFKNCSLRWVIMGALFLGGSLRAEILVDFPVPLGRAHEKPDPARDAYDLATLDQLSNLHPDLMVVEKTKVEVPEEEGAEVDAGEVRVVSSGLSGPFAWTLAGGFLFLGIRRLFE